MVLALVMCGLVVGSAQAGMVWDRTQASLGDGTFLVNGSSTFWSDADVWVMERPITYRSPLIRSTPLVKPDDFDVSDASRYHLAAEITPHRDWLQKLSVSNDAVWISVNERGSMPDVDTNSGLYAIMIYNVGDDDIALRTNEQDGSFIPIRANVDLYFTADNFLGGNGMAALYFNGDAVTEDDNGLWGNFETAAVQLFRNQYELHFYVDLQPGENWLYLDATSFYGPAGVIFAGNMSFSYVGVPEPMSMSLLAVGAMGMLIRRKR